MEIPRPLREDWALTRDALENLRDERTLALMARPGQPLEGASIVETRPDLPGVAIIHVKGTLTRYKSWWGGTTYGEVLKSYQRCLDDSSIQAIAWNFDSPGGEVNGCSEGADAIFAGRGKKPMVAYASYLCASGGLWLASAVGDLYCSDTAIIGSVGVLAYLYDDTKMMADVGIKQFEIVASQSPKKSQTPGDADYRSRVQQRLDDTCSVFIAKMARHYGVSADYVQKNFGQGDVFVGQKAIDAKLAIGLSNLESVLTSLSNQVASQTKTKLFTSTGARMDTKTMARLLGLDESVSERQIEDRAQQLAQLERSVLVATQSTDRDAALGKIGAAMSAVSERDAARAELKAQQRSSEREGFKEQLKAGYKSTRLVLGQLPNIAQLCMSTDNANKAIAAMAEVQKPTSDDKEAQKSYKKALFAAMTSVDISAEESRRLQGYLSLQAPQLPQAKTEPPDNKENRERVGAVSAADAAAAGISIERAQQLSKLRNAADLPLPVEKKGN